MAGTDPPPQTPRQWLVDNFPRGVDMEIPPRRDAREVPFADETGA